MAYAVDSNGFIQANNQYYGMDFCPAYWDWLLTNYHAGLVISIDRVYSEIQAHQDSLANWVSGPASGLFLPSADAATIACYQQVLTWVQQRRTPEGQQFYKNAVLNNFFGGGADPYLIAYAMAHNHTVVTLESSDQQRRNKVLIPVVCGGLGVPCITLFDMLRIEQAKFVLE
ncbi:MAG: DUF4411 family protein [Chloroflexota bacterium]|nr:DUF4411 family protein [Chloroflexota bacterium]